MAGEPSAEDLDSYIRTAHRAPEWDNDARAMHGLEPLAVPDPAAPDSSDPVAVKAAQRAARMDARKIANTVAGMMEIADVRTWIYRLLENCRAFTSHDVPYGERIDGLQLARNAAHREVCQFVTADIMAACPELYVQMLKENA
jgi:hypothetical protein